LKAVVFGGVGEIRLEDVPEPTLQAPTDAIVRLTASAICGTDLHFIRGTMPGTEEGRILAARGSAWRRRSASTAQPRPRRPRGHPFDDRLRNVLGPSRRLLRAMRPREPERPGTAFFGGEHSSLPASLTDRSAACGCRWLVPERKQG
jgi:hypothetical protein